MAPHPSTLAWKIPWTEEPSRLQSMGHWESDMTERLHFHFSLSCIGEGNGNYSSVLAWRIPGMQEPGGLPSMGLHRVGHDWSDSSNSSIRGFPGDSVVNNGDTGDSCSILRSGRSPGEENSDPPQYSCLWNPIDRGDWWATVHGITSQAPMSTHPKIIWLYQSCYCWMVHWIFKKINQ